MGTQVIAYRLAYVDEDVILCEEHAESYEYPLGPVQRGAHDGICEVCEPGDLVPGFRRKRKPG